MATLIQRIANTNKRLNLWFVILFIRGISTYQRRQMARHGDDLRGRAQGAQPGADPTTTRGMGPLLVTNIGIVLALVGAVVLIANNLGSIPGTVFVGVFGTLALLLVGVGGFQLRRNRPAAGRTWIFWAGIAYGLAIFSGAQLYGFTTFIPTLILLWVAGLTLLALWSGSAVQMGLAAILNGAWMYLTLLYGQSYLLGALILMMVYLFVFLRRRSTPLFVLAVLESILLLNLFFYDWIHPLHFPLHFSISHLLFTVALLGALGGLSGLFVRNAVPDAVWIGYAAALGWLTGAAGAALLLVLSFMDSWFYLNSTYDGNLLGIILGFVMLLTTAVLVFNRPAALGTRARFAGWMVGYLLLVAGLNNMPFTFQRFLPLVAALGALGVAVSLLIMGVRQLCWIRLGNGLLLMTLAMGAIIKEWTTHYLQGAMLAFAMAMMVLMLASVLRNRLATDATESIDTATGLKPGAVNTAVNTEVTV